MVFSKYRERGRGKGGDGKEERKERGREGETERKKERQGDMKKRDGGKLFTNSLIAQTSNLVNTKKKSEKSNI